MANGTVVGLAWAVEATVRLELLKMLGWSCGLKDYLMERFSKRSMIPPLLSVCCWIKPVSCMQHGMIFRDTVVCGWKVGCGRVLVFDHTESWWWEVIA